MNILNASLFGSRVQRKLGVGFHNVGSGVLRASDTATIEYVEVQYGQRCGHIPLDAQRVSVLVEAHTADIETHLDYLSLLFGKEIKAITSDELRREHQSLSRQEVLIVPYINVPEAEKRIEGELGAESWGMAGNMVSLLKNKADFCGLIYDLNLDGFQSSDYCISYGDDFPKKTLIFRGLFDGILQK